ncbi:Mdm33 family-domain-containing protein [Corynascus novoguineensis]|uniref:Sensitive to high expression protein 9, mitochondrial n=1 Tax=Corynascus novoguineensis TaxID=1126955 RepID=A0AAN7CTX2_9PEZI|nr:Mdm33 family-domain-containing protein [Corynascus novoguineensis]
MSAHTALRLAVRPLGRATFYDQLATAAAQKPLRQRVRPQICLHCSIAVHLGTNSGRARLFSTAPPPPRQPPLNLEDTIGKPEPEPTTSKDAPTTASSSASEPSNRTPQPDPEQAPSSNSPPSSPEPTSSEPAPESESNPSAESTSAEAGTRPQDSSLPSFTETHRHPLSARFSTFMDNIQSRAVTATQTLNDLTGYSAIEAIKSRNAQLEREHAAAQQRLRAARQNYKSLTSHRAATQREVTTLLARKDTWTPADLERFTALYRSDHELEAQVGAAAAELTEAEAEEARLSGELNAGILKRYHEEQIWSDRIRRQSTWGTWGLMGVNVVLFLVLQFVAEPWRRRRLVNGIAEREKGFMDEVRRELADLKAASETAATAATAAAAAASSATSATGTGENAAQALDTQGVGSAALDRPAMAVPVGREEWRALRKTWKEMLYEFWEDPELLREAALDLTSDRRVDLRMRDASLIALQGAAAGATVAVVVAVSILRST